MGNLPRARHPVAPRFVGKHLLPDHHVCLMQAVTPRPTGAAGVAEHSPVVKDVVAFNVMVTRKNFDEVLEWKGRQLVHLTKP